MTIAQHADLFRPRTLHVYLEDGTPQGLIVVDAGSNWTGKILCAPAGRVQQLLQRPEAAHGGVYIMTGEDVEQPGGKIAYIGEADDVASRMRDHLRTGKMDFERIALVVTVNNSLDKSRVRYLESQLLKRADRARRVTLVNRRLPEYNGLSEVDRVDMESFVEQALLIFPLFGFDLFRQLGTGGRTSKTGGTSAGDSIFVFAAAGASARAQETDDGFLVLAGSTARGGETPTFPTSYRTLREQLVADGALSVNADGTYAFTRDVLFTSSSAAAARGFFSQA